MRSGGRVEPLVPQRAPSTEKKYLRWPGAGRPPKPARQVFEAIVYVLRTGCQWKALPKERFGSASAIHERLLEWEAAGFFAALWAAGLGEYDEMEGIAWRWQSVDGAMMKAPLAQEAVGPNPTDRGKNGRKRHLLVDGRGVPLSLIVTGANVNDGKRLDEVLSASMVKRPNPPHRRSKHLCARCGLPKRRVSSHHRRGRLHSSCRRSSEGGRPQAARSRTKRPGVGWLKSVIAGSAAFANCSSDTKN